MLYISHKVNSQNILLRKVIKKGNNWLLHFQLYRKLVKIKVVWVVWGKKSYKEKSCIREKVEKDCKKCLKDILQYYVSLVGKKIRKETVEDSEEEGEKHPNKKSKQTNVLSFFESKKLEKGKIENINHMITKTFVIFHTFNADGNKCR